jgi:predicted XRE-type DNA-binding protein
MAEPNPIPPELTTQAIINFWNKIEREDTEIRLSNSPRRIAKGEANHFAKLSEDQVREIRNWHASNSITQSELASLFHVNHQTIHNIVHRKSWSHI